MKYIKLLENWLNPENHMDKIDSILDTNAKTQKNKLSDKLKNQNTSKPFNIKTSKWIRLDTDKVEGRTDAQSKNIIVISNDKGRTGLGIFMYMQDISQSYEDLSVHLSIQVVGAYSCIEESCEMKILFTDGERMSKYGINRYNCDQSAIFDLSFFDIEKFKTKKIETLRVYTSLGKYVQVDLSSKNQEDFINTLNDFSSYMDTLIDLHTAIRKNRLDMVKGLLSSGIDPNIKDGKGNYPIHMAVQVNNLELLKLLIEKGANINIKSSEPMYIGGSTYYATPLDLAIRNKNEEIIEFLEGIGAEKTKNENKKENTSNQTTKNPIVITASKDDGDVFNSNTSSIETQRHLVYPEMARRAGVEGSVVVKVLIGKDGRPKPGKTIIEETASELLNPAAIKAIMSEVFPVATENGEPVETWLKIPVKFKIDR